MKKLIIAVLVVVVLFALVSVQPALAVKPGQITYFVTLEEGVVTTTDDCGQADIKLGFRWGADCLNIEEIALSATDNTDVILVKGGMSIKVVSGKIVAINSIAFTDKTGTRWSAEEVQASSVSSVSCENYDGKKDTDGFTVTVTGGELTLTKSVKGKDKKADPVTITINPFGNIVFRTHPDDSECPHLVS